MLTIAILSIMVVLGIMSLVFLGRHGMSVRDYMEARWSPGMAVVGFQVVINVPMALVAIPISYALSKYVSYESAICFAFMACIPLLLHLIIVDEVHVQFVKNPTLSRAVGYGMWLLVGGFGIGPMTYMAFN